MKLFITDYDGTLFIDDESLKKNNEKLKKLHKLGVSIVISTGRSFNSIKKQVIEHNIYYDYLHCADGACIFDKNDNLINFYNIDHFIAYDLLSLSKKMNYDEIQICYPKSYENIYHNKDEIGGINIVIRSENYQNTYKDEFFSLNKKYPEYNFLFYDHGTYIYLCVKDKNVSKAKAIEFMENKYNISKDDIYVIGDSDNDLEMITNYHGVSIISKNENIKKASSKQYNQVYEYIDDILKKLENDV